MAGLEDSHVLRVEHGHGCTLSTAVKLARVFGIDLNTFKEAA